MPAKIRSTRSSCRNLPRIVGNHRLTVTIHTEGDLAGFTVVEGDARALRSLVPSEGWREHAVQVVPPLASEPESEQDDPPSETGPSLVDVVDEILEKEPVIEQEEPLPLEAWAEALVANTVESLEEELDGLDPSAHTLDHLAALLAAENARVRTRRGALDAIDAWGAKLPEE